MTQKTPQSAPAELKVAIFVPDEDAKKFLLFQQHYDAFSTMLEQGVFDSRSSSVTLHFDQSGDLGAIDKTTHAWNSRKLRTGEGVQSVKDALP